MRVRIKELSLFAGLVILVFTWVSWKLSLQPQPVDTPKPVAPAIRSARAMAIAAARAGSPVAAPAGLQLELVVPDGMDISVTPYEGSGDTVYDEFFTKVRDWEPHKPYLALMTNRSALPVRALVTEWKFVGPEGQEIDSHIAVHYQANKKQPPVQPGETVLITPSGWIPDPATPGIAGYPGPGIPAGNLVQSAKVILRVDAIMLSDGKTQGPNSTGGMTSLIDNRRKGRQALLHAQEMMDGGADVPAVKTYLSGQARALTGTLEGPELEFLADSSGRKELSDRLKNALASRVEYSAAQRK
jgi:hypothetical protein